MSQAARSIARAARRGLLPGWIDPTETDAVGDLGSLTDNPQPEVEVVEDESLKLEDLTVVELRAMADDLEIEGRSRMNKATLIEAIRGA